MMTNRRTMPLSLVLDRVIVSGLDHKGNTNILPVQVVGEDFLPYLCGLTGRSVALGFFHRPWVLRVTVIRVRSGCSFPVDQGRCKPCGTISGDVRSPNATGLGLLGVL